MADITIQALDSSSNPTGSVVIINVNEIDDARSNKLFNISPARGTQEHSLGPDDAIIVNLLRVTRTLVMTGYVTATSTQTAKQVKSNIINIYEGITGGNNNKGVRLVYDGENIQGVIEKLAINEKPHDEPTSPPEEMIKYTVQITFTKGIPR